MVVHLFQNCFHAVRILQTSNVSLAHHRGFSLWNYVIQWKPNNIQQHPFKKRGVVLQMFTEPKRERPYLKICTKCKGKGQKSSLSTTDRREKQYGEWPSSIKQNRLHAKHLLRTALSLASLQTGMVHQSTPMFSGPTTDYTNTELSSLRLYACTESCDKCTPGSMPHQVSHGQDQDSPPR